MVRYLMKVSGYSRQQDKSQLDFSVFRTSTVRIPSDWREGVG